MSSEAPRLEFEFVVQMTCESCERTIKNALESNPNITLVSIDRSKERVVVKSNGLSATAIINLLEATGRRAVLIGSGSAASGMKNLDYGAGVAVLGDAAGRGVRGVARFFQPTDEECFVEGTVDGLKPGEHVVCVHELGDLSSADCSSCGDVFQGLLKQNQGSTAPGYLGCVTADSDGRLEFKLSSSRLKLWELVGRSLVLHAGNLTNTCSSYHRVACGVIARSAGLFSNEKRLCDCDGVTVWDERDRPVAGAARRQPQVSSTS